MRRETCRMCWRPNPIGFHVPDDVWHAIVPAAMCDEVLCIMCFARFGDEAMVEWERDIELYPVSAFSLHQRAVESTREEQR